MNNQEKALALQALEPILDGLQLMQDRLVWEVANRGLDPEVLERFAKWNRRICARACELEVNG